MRPCEDVIVISDHEEGELTDSDEAPPPPRRRRYVPLRAAAPVFRHKERLIRQSISRSFVAIVHSPRYKKLQLSKRKILKSESDSDAENIPRKKKLSKLFSQKKISSSSLQSRLSNMIKFDSTKRIKNNTIGSASADVDLEPVDSADNLSESERNVSPVSAASPKLNATDLSDDDPDILRELALKSKTHRVLQNKMEDNLEHDESAAKENDDTVKTSEGDKEIQELRLAALKSAMLMRASKRKRLRKDSKKIRKEKQSLSVAISNHGSEESLLLQNTDKTDYNNYMYNIPDPHYNTEILRPHTPDVGIANDVVKDKSDDESEEILRCNLLASLKNIAKTPPVVSLKPKLSVAERDLDSNLIIRLGGSDSESDCEATKNLAIMHKKLEEQTDFQRNLDLYLKGAREATEIKSSPLTNKIIDLKTTSAGKNNGVSQTSIDNMSVNNQQEYLELMKRLDQLENPATFNNVPAMSKNNVYSLNQNRNGNYLHPKLVSIKKDARGVTKSSINTNRKIFVNENGTRSQGASNETKVFDQQLILIRKKISSQLEIIENQKISMKNHHMKKDLLERQIKNATILLHNTKRAILLNQRDQNNSHRILNQLKKNQLILQNRLPKTIAKRNIENLQPNKNLTIKIDNTRLHNPNSLNVDSNKKANILQTSNHPTLNSRDENPSIEVKPNLPNMPADDKNLLSNSDESSREPIVKCEETRTVVSMPNEIIKITISDKSVVENITNLQLETVIQELRPNIKDDDVSSSFIEYDSPLLRLKSDHSWSNDPQDILCPFDVSGCCKDPKCIYIHSKDVNMAN